MNQIKTIDGSTKEFVANGQRYFVQKSITPLRYKEYEKLVPKLTFGLSFQEVYQQLHRLWNMLDKQQFANAAVVCHNLLNGIKDIDDEKRVHPAMMMAALFICRENEDPAKYDEQLMLEKIADWQVEGYDFWSFFALSVNSIRGFRETLLRYTQQNLEEILKEDINIPAS